MEEPYSELHVEQSTVRSLQCVAREPRSRSLAAKGAYPMFYSVPTLYDSYVVCWSDRVRISARVLDIIIIIIIITYYLRTSLLTHLLTYCNYYLLVTYFNWVFTRWP